ncbi:MAG: cyclic 2,3-diphosphoglycerate synthase [Gammaproteobacteria bacterium]|nr:cyclic 2,3-diphosphoglycerate synthase [Gammaproteobacteria bacterium]
MKSKIIVMGAAGRDFHVFNCCYRDRAEYDVVAITAAQIPHIEGRLYPAAIAGRLYPDGIPIRPEDELESLIRAHDADEVVFAYSDVSLAYVDQCRQRVESAGATFSTFDVDASMLEVRTPVIAVTAIRTGCGKSQTSRRVVQILRDLGKKAVVVRHPMPYGDLERQRVQRFASFEDLDRHECTIEEREEYEPHLKNDVVVYAGVDYAAILGEAEREADVIVWDGGNNDTPFYEPDLWIVVADPHRAGHELDYFPGTVNFARADLILINKVDSASADDVDTIRRNARRVNPNATVVLGDSLLDVPDPASIAGKRVLAIEDGPTTTHGGMPFGAGTLAARRYGAAEIVDPRPWAVGEIAETFDDYPGTGPLLPAMGYGEKQIRDLAATTNAVDCDLVLIATPVDLSRLIEIRQPHMRIGYRLEEQGDALLNAITKMMNEI